MKKHLFLPLILLPLALFTGFLLSKASLVGRAGITLFFQEYRFLKVWWQAGLVVWAVWLLLVVLQSIAVKKLSRRTAIVLSIFLILLCVSGFYFTWQDFHHSISHRMLGKRFHAGGYLFWAGWLISILFTMKKREQKQSEA